MPSHKRLERTGGEAVCHDTGGGGRRPLTRAPLGASRIPPRQPSLRPSRAHPFLRYENALDMRLW
jgi:hypothetical protein